LIVEKERRRNRRRRCGDRRGHTKRGERNDQEESMEPWHRCILRGRAR